MKILITRHKALVEYLLKKGIIDKDTQIKEHAIFEDMQNKDVIGNLPLRLAVHARTITDITLNVPQGLRGKELTLQQVEKYASEPRTYKVIPAVMEKLTVNDLVDKLRLPGDQSVIARSGQRGRLTSELKKQLISTRQRRLSDGTYLFSRCEARKFKV